MLGWTSNRFDKSAKESRSLIASVASLALKAAENVNFSLIVPRYFSLKVLSFHQS